MTKPSIFRIVLMDLTDFFIIASLTALGGFAIYHMHPSVTLVDFSYYFFEQFIEVFFVNPKLFIWCFCLGFLVTLIYFMLCAMILSNTIGGHIARLKLIDKRNQLPIRLHHALLMAIGAYLGVWTLFLGPLSTWWLHDKHRGWSLLLSGTILSKK